MPNFIQCLLQNHRHTDKEAIKLHMLAEKKAMAKAKKNGGGEPGADEIGDELELLLLEQLRDIDLQTEVCGQIQQLNWDWRATVAKDDLKYRCGTVQTILHNTLGTYKDKQPEESEETCKELLTACNTYIAHLDGVIDGERHTNSIGTGAAGNKKYAKLKEERDGLDDEADMGWDGDNKKLEKAWRQRDVANIIHSILNDETKSHFQRIQEVKQIYNNNRRLLASSRDNASELFKRICRAALHLVTSGSVAAASIWKTPEKHYTETFASHARANRKG